MYIYILAGVRYMSGVKSVQKPKYRSVHVMIREDLYLKLWEIVKRRFAIPHKKFHIVLNEAIEEYVNRHLQESQNE